MKGHYSAVELYVIALRKEYGDSLIRNCPPDNYLRDERFQLIEAYKAGAEESQDMKIQTLSQYAIDYVFKIFKK